jgi:predicted small integral membrane protein
MMLRTSKVMLVFGVALFYSLVVLNNTTDYNSNYQFIRHVLMMDSTLPGNNAMWRAMNSPVWHTIFYFSIITWESTTMVLAWWGGVNMARSLRAPAAAFNQAKKLAIAALTVSLLIWLVAFLSVGGEWFLMWQSKTWNGQDAAFRMLTVVGLVLLVVLQPDADGQP